MGRIAGGKVRDVAGIRHSYPHYRYMSNNPVSLNDYIAIACGYFKLLISLVLEGHDVQLPLGMGRIYIRGRKEKPKIDAEGNITGLAPDWVETKKLWLRDPEAAAKKKMIYCTNEHTNGIRYAIGWVKAGIDTENISFYSLKFIKQDKMALSKLIKSGKEYFVIN